MKSSYSTSTWIGPLILILAPGFAMAKEAPPKNRIPIENARATAIATYDGTVQGEELEFEGGKWIYSFDLKSKKDKLVHEVHVDAISGKVSDVHIETARDEQKEAIEDAKEK